MSTPSQLRRRAQKERDKAAKLRAEADRAEALAALWETTARQLEGMGLPTVPKPRTVVQMDADSREYKIGKARVGDHPFPRALYDRGLTVKEWAEAHKLTREKVRSWFLAGDGGRRVPREWAERIEREFGIPLTAWPHGVK